MKLIPSPALVPVILSGGMGTRLWPRSRENFPKQFLPLGEGGVSLFRETLLRVRDKSRFAAPVIICNEEHRFLVAEELQRAHIEDAAILLEPVGRNTAPAITAAACYLAGRIRNAAMLVLPSDHILRDEGAFLHTVEQASRVEDRFVTFGLVPDRAETGFGYIKVGEEITPGCSRVARFLEKPDKEKAELLVASGALWNSGMFLFPVAPFLEEVKRLRPEIAMFAAAAVRHATTDKYFTRLEPRHFAAMPSISIDHALMERTERAAVVPCSFGWSDAGTWEALWRLSPKDESGNAVSGEHFACDTENCHVSAEDVLPVATLGVRDLVIVTTKDCVLVADKSRAQEVRQLAEQVREARPKLVENYRQEHRPWGHFDALSGGERHKVKRLLVKPDGSISSQMHHHRSEHWVVVRGTARVTLNGAASIVTENQSIYIPCGAMHKLENPGKIPLEVIEVQSGSYLGEDDIVRFDDQYGREEEKIA